MFECLNAPREKNGKRENDKNMVHMKNLLNIMIKIISVRVYVVGWLGK